MWNSLNMCVDFDNEINNENEISDNASQERVEKMNYVWTMKDRERMLEEEEQMKLNARVKLMKLRKKE